MCLRIISYLSEFTVISQKEKPGGGIGDTTSKKTPNVQKIKTLMKNNRYFLRNLFNIRKFSIIGKYIYLNIHNYHISNNVYLLSMSFQEVSRHP